MVVCKIIITKKAYMIKFLRVVICLFVALFSMSAEARYGLDAVEIYKQARLKNYNFLEYISDYGNLIDNTNRFGDSALCVAIKYRDKDTARLLIKYGANKNHQCLRRLQANNTRVQSVAKSNIITNKRPAPTYVSNGNNGNYLLWGGIGALAVGGVALAGGGGGGGGSHDEVIKPIEPDEPNNPDDDTGDDDTGDDGTGDDGTGDDGTGDDGTGDDGTGDDGTGDDGTGDDGTGDDGTGDDGTGDDGTGDDGTGDDGTGDDGTGDDGTGDDGTGDDGTGDDGTGDDGTGDDGTGDDGTGDDGTGDDGTGDDGTGDDGTGDDGTGDDGTGDDGTGDDGGNDEVKLYDVSSSEFRTSEYSKGNFLGLIRAAEAYAHMYKKDANGKLISHQAGSDDPLEKVKVGVIDVGVYANNDIKDKISMGFDANTYNNVKNAKVYVDGDIHYYVLENGSKYYLLPVNTITTTMVGYEDQIFESKSDLENALLKNYSLTLDKFKIINSGGSNPGYNYPLTDNFETWWNYIVSLSHGTHIAGIIGASKNNNGMHGVAFENAEIVGASWDLDQNMYATVVGMVDEGVKVLNNSWGDKSTDIKNASTPNWLKYYDENTLLSYAYAASKGAVWVQSTGNDGKNEGVVQNAIGGMNLSDYGYSGDKEYEVSYVAVTALGTDGRIASYANKCGSASAWCIAAPGTDIISTDASDNGYMIMDGTSMAAPVVSGSIALLQGYYPWLNTKNIAYLLLETANDSGVYANSAVYGKGALDLEAAVTTPIGGLGLPEESDLSSLKSVGLTRLATSDVVQNKLLKAMPKTITAYDALKRPFEYETAKLIKTTHGSSANLRNDVSRIAMADSGVKTIRDDKTGFMFRSSQSLNNEGNYHLSTAEVVNESESGATRFYYAENSNYINNDDALKSDNNPYLSMRNAYGVENSLNLSDTSKLKLSMQIGENGLFNRDEDIDKHNFDERAYSIGAEYSFNLTDYLELSTLGGMLFEEDAMLGLNGEGGFNVNDSSTYYMGLRAKLNLTNNISLLAAYYRGYTSGFDSNMLSISDLETESFMLAGEYNLNASDKVGLMLSSPMSVAKGSASMTYSTGRDNYSNSAYLNKIKTSLRPEAKEYDLGMYFKSKPSDNVSLSGKFETRFNADGKRGVEDYIGVVGAHIKW